MSIVMFFFILNTEQSSSSELRSGIPTECTTDLRGVSAVTIWAASWQNQHPPSLIRVFAVRMKKAWVLSYPLSAQRRLWSDWADAQADLSLRWAHSHFVGFVTRRLMWPFQKKQRKKKKNAVSNFFSPFFQESFHFIFSFPRYKHLLRSWQSYNFSSPFIYVWYYSPTFIMCTTLSFIFSLTVWSMSKIQILKLCIIY